MREMHYKGFRVWVEHNRFHWARGSALHIASIRSQIDALVNRK